MRDHEVKQVSDNEQLMEKYGDNKEANKETILIDDEDFEVEKEVTF